MQKQKKKDVSEPKVFEVFGHRNMNVSETQRIVLSYGCDGKEHAVQRSKETLRNGNVVYAENEGMKISGPCTGNCKGKDNLGYFIMNG